MASTGKRGRCAGSSSYRRPRGSRRSSSTTCWCRATATARSTATACPTPACSPPSCGRSISRAASSRRRRCGRAACSSAPAVAASTPSAIPADPPHARPYPRRVTESASPGLSLVVDGRAVDVPDDGGSLLDVLREVLGLRTLKDGCSPQGQCGCCTVLVDGQPRVACVTPARRVRGRSITTVEGLDPAERRAWGEAFCATGGSQCGFCTPGIVMRLSALRARGVAIDDHAAVEQALLAHLCRCTGWRTILDAWSLMGAPRRSSAAARDRAAAARRAAIEGRTPQRVDRDVPLGQGGFADDTAPAGALVAVPDGSGGWAVGESPAEARTAARKVQGRRTTAELRHPLDLPPGAWDVTLRTTWVEPAYLELDASWCAPGGEPASPLANGGAFGGKVATPVTAAARELADQHGRPVRVLLAREDAARLGPKRPPVAGGAHRDGTGVLRVAATPGAGAAVAGGPRGRGVEPVVVRGPPTSLHPRAAGWAEAAVLL